MTPSIKEKLLRLAIENPGTKGRFKVAAGVIYKNRLMYVGVNSYKTNPIMLNGDYRVGQIHLHAEADALVQALRGMSQRQLAKSAMWVVRVKRSPSGGFTEALARPCPGCWSLINESGIKEVEWTEDE